MAHFIRFFTLFIILEFSGNNIICYSQDYQQYDDDELYNKLKKIPGLFIKKIETLKGYKESYELALVQPIDHNNPGASKYTQRIFLSHIDFSRPVVIETHGYDVSWHKKQELSELLNANQIIVEHRFYGTSRPEPLDWEYLTSWQAASDHHRVISILKNIYKKKWVSTGKSKGGMASLFLEYYYPDDIDATVAFVAPIIDGLKDQRMNNYINKIDNVIEKQKIKEFQIHCLEKRDSLRFYLKKYLDNQGMKYSMSLDSILEWSVIEFPYEFCCRKYDPDHIPNKNSSCNTFFSYLNKISPTSKLCDRFIQFNYPLVWQEISEFGYYAYEVGHLSSLLKVVIDPDISCFLPKNAELPEFNSDEMQIILKHLQNVANNIIYLYGEYDIWTAASVNPGSTTNSIQIKVEGFGHSFKMSNMSIIDKNRVINSLKSWIQ